MREVMAPEHRAAPKERITSYVMTTSGRPSPVTTQCAAHSRSHSQSHSHSPSPASSPTAYVAANAQAFLANKGNTPLASPRAQYAAASPYHLPKPSPTAARAPAQGPRAPSPNYFAFAVEPPSADPRDSLVGPRENWSSPSSSIKSFAAAIPKPLPLDANPEYEAFKRQVDLNRGRTAVNLSTSLYGLHSAGSPASSLPALSRPRPSRWHTLTSGSSDTSLSHLSLLNASRSPIDTVPGPPAAGAGAGANRVEGNAGGLVDSACMSSDSQRPSQTGTIFNALPSLLEGAVRHESPAQPNPPLRISGQHQVNLSRVDDRQPRLSMMASRTGPSTLFHGPVNPPRAETVPARLKPGGHSMITGAKLGQLVEQAAEHGAHNAHDGNDSGNDDRDGSGAMPGPLLLLLDLRVSPQYAQSRIKGSLNLCIPTTLLKRATFNLQKLQQTFQSQCDQDRFAAWSRVSHLVVYDASSSEKHEAPSAVNMLNKFIKEGFSGSASILHGGFHAFAATHPHLIDHSSSGAPSPSLSLVPTAGGAGRARPRPPPVIGGVVLPSGTNGSNPFFSNIRQNQDLVDGVGQMNVAVPPGLDMEILPAWLREAAAETDRGKTVADKFLSIELAEQARMKEAYSMSEAPLPPVTGERPSTSIKVQLSGIEKGCKNRYKDILPFEHARVRLQGRCDGDCDYVNASHIQATRSHKRYIASQGPLPATCEDFWSMIWDQDVRVIVMLTAESEGGQLKCHPYWQGNEYGPIKLRCLSEKKVSLDIDGRRHAPHTPSMRSRPAQATGHPSNGPAGSSSSDFSWGSTAELGRRRASTTTTLPSGLGFGNTHDGRPGPTGGVNSGPNGSGAATPFVIMRKFALSHTGHPFAPIREITHLHYPSWPDFGAPAQPSHLLALIGLANIMQRAAKPLDTASASLGARGNNTRGGSVQRAEADGHSIGGAEEQARQRRGDPPMFASWHDAPEPRDELHPMLVHCSAGCGRTGTFCTVDSVVDMLKWQRLRATATAKATTRISHQARQQARPMHPDRDADGDVPMSEISSDQDQPDDSFLGGLSLQEATSPPTFQAPWNGEPRRYEPTGRQRGETARLDDEVDGDEETHGRDDQGNRHLDMSWLEDETVDLIARTVEDFRGQRLSMVQSLRQFVLCYETILEWAWRQQEQGGGGRAKSRTGSLAL